jgi:SAM-dependent methyltransferase
VTTAARRIGELRAANGWRWTAWYLVRAALRRAQEGTERRLAALERRRGLPGANALAENVRRWNEHDWQQLGEEWTVSAEWKQALIDEVMAQYVPPGATVVEIGPGGGRWSEPLQQLAERLVLVDPSERCIEICRQRLAYADNVEYHVNDGSSLSFLADGSVDVVWSFDVFVHVSPVETERYVAEIGRVLRPGGRAVIHHGNVGCTYEHGFRSRTTAADFRDLVAENDLTLLRQFDSWGEGGRFDVRTYGDVITAFARRIAWTVAPFLSELEPALLV